MAFDGAGADMESLRDVVVVEAGGIEPLFESGGLAGVAEASAGPGAAQRGNFVEAGAAAGGQGERGIGADCGIHDGIGAAEVVGDFEATDGVELVVGVERRGVADGTALFFEYLLAALGVVIELVGVRRRLERLDVEGEGVELLVAVASAFFGAEGGGAGTRLEVTVVRQCVETFVDNGVAHDVADAAVADQAGGIEVVMSAMPTREGIRTGWDQLVPWRAKSPGCWASSARTIPPW